MTKITRNEHLSVSGTSRVGEVEIPPAALRSVWGDPIEGDGYKVTGEYTFSLAGLTYTVYDFKCTKSYSDRAELESDDFWDETEPQRFSIGGRSRSRLSVEDFKKELLKSVGRYYRP